MNASGSPFAGIQQLIDCLHSNLIEVQSLAAETLSHVITFRMAYKTIRRNGGIKKLVREFSTILVHG